MVKPFAYMLLLLSLLCLATDAAAAVMTPQLSVVRVSQPADHAGKLSRSTREDPSVPPIWHNVAIETTTSYTPSGGDTQKTLVRQCAPFRSCGAHADADACSDRMARFSGLGARSSDAYVVAYRKIVI